MFEDFVRSKGLLTLGSRLKRIGERLQAETQQVMNGHGVPIQAGQYPVVAALDECGPLSVGDLATALGVTQPGITRTIGDLATMGFVAVERSATDQRVRIVTLTPAGQDLVRRGRESVWPVIERCVDEALAGEGRSLLDHLDRLETALRETPFGRRLERTAGDLSGE